jgi:hypothetical protein
MGPEIAMLAAVTMRTQGVADSLLQVSTVPLAMVSVRVVMDAGTLVPANVKAWLFTGSVFTKAQDRLVLLLKQ